MTSDEANGLQMLPSRQFVAWMYESGVSLVFTTYQAGKLFLLGAHDAQRMAVFERSFARCMGLWAEPERLLVSSLYQIWQLENCLEQGQTTAEGQDRLYLPQVSYVTGDVDAHDLVVEKSGRVVFVNTLFSCLAALSVRHSFEPLWKPRFVSRLAAEDRCHLNGLALRDGRARYVSALSTSDVADGWRDHRAAGGVVIDVDSDEVLAGGLSMPHSPRWYRDRLWLLDSGRGYFGHVDQASGRFEPVTFCPGYLRGLAFVGDYAIVGLSRAREASSFAGLELGERLRQQALDARCGLLVIDLRSGDIVHWLRIEGVVEELYDVAVLPGVKRPAAIGLLSGEIQRTVTLGPAGKLHA